MIVLGDSLERLISINAAVAAIEGGAQEYKIGSQMVKRADLATLYSERRRLQSEVDGQGKYNTTTAVFARR